jgi:phosphoglycolate phosphatase
MHRSSSRLVWLFDVDGTLITTDGAARQAFSAALRDCLGIEDDLGELGFAGRTDLFTLGEVLRKHRRAVVDGELARFWSATCRAMEPLLIPGRGRVMKGVPELLSAIGDQPDWVTALLTGNSSEMAALKLRHFGLDGHFDFGAFGEEARDRDALAGIAVARAAARCGVPPRRCVVVGDTEHDVACARAAGAHAVAVASGQRTRAELAACAPDLLLDDLSVPALILDWARGLPAA